MSHNAEELLYELSRLNQVERLINLSSLNQVIRSQQVDVMSSMRCVLVMCIIVSAFQLAMYHIIHTVLKLCNRACNLAIKLRMQACSLCSYVAQVGGRIVLPGASISNIQFFYTLSLYNIKEKHLGNVCYTTFFTASQ